MSDWKIEVKSKLLARERRSLARKILSICGSSGEEEVPWKSSDESVQKTDPLVYCSRFVFPSSPTGRFGFYHEEVKPPMFSRFLARPVKSTEKLEELFDKASEIYEGSGITPVAMFLVGREAFTYSSFNDESDSRSFISVVTRGRRRFIHSLASFIHSAKMVQGEYDESIDYDQQQEEISGD